MSTGLHIAILLKMSSPIVLLSAVFAVWEWAWEWAQLLLPPRLRLLQEHLRLRPLQGHLHLRPLQGHLHLRPLQEHLRLHPLQVHLHQLLE